jgi:hypothetical protein
MTPLLLTLVGTLATCVPVRSKSSVVGVYELSGDHRRIVLDLTADGQFTETITSRSGSVEKRTGKWLWNNDGLSLDELWIPKEFAPDYILQADSESGTQPKYTVPGHWSVSPEYHWGTVVFEVFPDADVSFRKISRPQ